MCFGVGTPSDLREVLLLDPEARMRERVREVPVVREEQESLGVPVQPPHREDPRSLGKEASDVRATLRVAHRRDDTGWLVEGVVLHVGVEVDLETIDPDLILDRIRPVAEGREGAVQGHAALDDQFLAGTT